MFILCEMVESLIRYIMKSFSYGHQQVPTPKRQKFGVAEDQQGYEPTQNVTSIHLFVQTHKSRT